MVVTLENLLPAVYDFSKPVYDSSKLGAAKNLCNSGLLAVKILDCVNTNMYPKRDNIEDTLNKKV